MQVEKVDEPEGVAGEVVLVGLVGIGHDVVYLVDVGGDVELEEAGKGWPGWRG